MPTVQHINLHHVRKAMEQSDSIPVSWIDIADSRSEWRTWRDPGKIFRHFDVQYAALLVQGGVGANNGLRDGLGNFPIGGITGVTSSFVLPGQTGAGSGIVNRWPVQVLEVWTTGATSNPHFGRYNVVSSSSGYEMNSTASSGSTGGTLFRGDPLQGRSVQSVESFFITDNRNIWQGSRVEMGFNQFENGAMEATTANTLATGASGGTLQTFTATPPANSTGPAIRVRQRHLQTAPSTGTGHLLAGTRINFAGGAGLILDSWSISGYQTTDHLPQNPYNAGATNTDWKYSQAKATEWFQTAHRTTTAVVAIELGQNQSSTTGFPEWDGNTVRSYKAHIGMVMHARAAELTAAGVTDLTLLLLAPWRAPGDTSVPQRLDQCAQAMRELTADWDGFGVYPGVKVAFYDQMNALEEAGHATGGALLSAFMEDSAHQNFDGNNALGSTLWNAISTAEEGQSRLARVVRAPRSIKV